MTQAQAEAYLCGIDPDKDDARFVSQHRAAYAFTRRFVAGKRVLEIGFGDGYGSNDLAEVAREVVGIDLAPGNIPRAQAKYPRANLRFLHMSAPPLAFQDGAFDVVASFQLIEHIPEPELVPFLSEIARVLAPDGLYCLSTLNLEHNRKPGRPYEKLCLHEKEFTGPELRALLERVFPYVELHGLYLTPQHRLCQRLKRWGLMTWGPRRLNPVARFYDGMSTEAYRTKPGISRAALDLFAVCRQRPPAW